MKEDNQYDILLKLILLGNYSVGKSSLLLRFADNKFTPNYHSTIGVDFRVTDSLTPNLLKVRTQIWDTAGQERFRCITRALYNGCHAAMLVYDITNKSSFENIPKWMMEVRRNCGDIPFIIVGNKSDMSMNRCVSTDEAMQLVNDMKSSQYTPLFLEVSAKDDPEQVKIAFEKIIQICSSKLEDAMNIISEKPNEPLKGHYRSYHYPKSPLSTTKPVVVLPPTCVVEADLQKRTPIIFNSCNGFCGGGIQEKSPQ